MKALAQFPMTQQRRMASAAASAAASRAWSLASVLVKLPSCALAGMTVVKHPESRPSSVYGNGIARFNRNIGTIIRGLRPQVAGG